MEVDSTFLPLLSIFPKYLLRQNKTYLRRFERAKRPCMLNIWLMFKLDRKRIFSLFFWKNFFLCWCKHLTAARIKKSNLSFWQNCYKRKSIRNIYWWLIYAECFIWFATPPFRFYNCRWTVLKLTYWSSLTHVCILFVTSWCGATIV